MTALLGVLLSASAASAAGAKGRFVKEGVEFSDFWKEFIARKEFRSRLKYHPETNELLRKAPQPCNLTGAWTGIAKDAMEDEYYLTSETATTFSAVAVSSGNWATGQGTISPDMKNIHIDLDKSSVQGVSLNGTITNCNRIEWSNGTVWSRQQAIKKVHVIFMNHLDIGYGLHTPEGDPTAFMATVLNSYTSEYFPEAQRLSKAMRDLNTGDGFLYTTHPWLVSLYIDCPPDFVLANGTKLFCPTAEEKAAFQAAVKRGDITWHDGPFNLQSENVGWSGFFEWSLQLSKDINTKLGLPQTTNKVYNLRDVPGTTRAVVPLLVKNGYKALTVGQNGGTPTPPGWYPHKMFKWVDKPSGTEILVMNHAGGYPNDPGPDPQHCGGLCRNDCMMVEGFDEALCFAFRTDNSGPPPSVQAVMNIFEILRVEFPGATVKASTLASFVDAALASSTIDLPTITTEIGDTWIQGVQSDPKKMARYRAMVREFENCGLSGQCSITDPRVFNATRLALTIPEHTWGLPGFVDNTKWTNSDFAKSRVNNSAWTNMRNGWKEHRVWLDYAVEALGDHPVASNITAAMHEVELAVPPSTDGYTPAKAGDVFTCGAVKVRFDATCAMDKLFLGGRDWASSNAVFGRAVYSTYTENDFSEMAKAYIGPTGGGCGYYKPNMDKYSNCTRGDYTASMTKLLVKTTNQGQCQFQCWSKMPAETVSYYGAAETMVAVVEVVGNGAVDVDFQAWNKTTTRLAEAMHYEFYPAQVPGQEWVLDKLGSGVSPYDTIANGNPKQHSVWKGVSYGPLSIESLDVAVVSPITPTSPPTPFLKDLRPIPSGTVSGMGFNVWNNIWDTNYVFYYPFLFDNTDRNIRSRFRITA